MKSRITKISLVCMAAVILLACGGGGGGGGDATPTPTPTATPTPTPAPATHVTINSIDSSTCSATVAYVTVTDEYGELITGLTQSDFTLLVGGIETSITGFQFIESASTPVSISFVMDYSRSAEETLAAMQDAVINFIEQMDNDDEGQVIRFAGTYDFTEFTTVKADLIAAINTDFPDPSNTNLYSPLLQAISDASATERTGRGAIIVFTDGFHNFTSFPTYTMDDVIDAAVTNAIPVFVVGYLSERDDDPARIESDRTDLQRLAHDTGGVYLEASGTDNFEALYQQMADLIQNQYQITFNGVGGSDLQIRVENAGPVGLSDVKTYACPVDM